MVPSHSVPGSFSSEHVQQNARKMGRFSSETEEAPRCLTQNRLLGASRSLPQTGGPFWVESMEIKRKPPREAPQNFAKHPLPGQVQRLHPLELAKRLRDLPAQAVPPQSQFRQYGYLAGSISEWRIDQRAQQKGPSFRLHSTR